MTMYSLRVAVSFCAHKILTNFSDLKIHRNYDSVAVFCTIVDIQGRNDRQCGWSLVCCRLAVVALDGGEPPRSGTLVVDVNVRDSNDNSPQFPGNATFIATVDENVRVGTVIATLNAVDHDTGNNAEISYKLSPETARDFGRTFGVRPRTGELFTRAALDHETRSEYVLTTALDTTSALDHETRSEYVLYVTASDRTGSGNDVMAAEGSLTSQALVIVRVQDVNDNAPRIGVHVLQQSSRSSASGPVARLRDVQRRDVWQLEVAEGVPEGTLVAHVTTKFAMPVQAQDADGAYFQVVYTL